MEYPVEWKKRIDRWTKKLAEDLYAPLAPIEWEGFVTTRRLGYDRAMKEGVFSPMPAGTPWGRDWDYLWVKGTVTLPEEAAGKRIVMKLDAGGESAVYVNGKEFGCRRNDWVRDETHRMSDLVLTDSGVPGTVYQVVLEAYAGHNIPGSVARGPVFPDFRDQDPDGSKVHAKIGESTFGIWNEEAFQLYVDVKLLTSAYGRIPAESLHKQDIWAALKQFTLTVDFAQEPAKRTACYKKARRELAPILARHNGSVSPRFYAFGHAHIDVAWLWPLAETERKIHRTFAGQVALMDRYPDYKFLQSQPHLYRMTKELYPDLYARIKEKVAAGQWIPEGGMWVEADTNISGGEALIRQFVHGKRFFKEEFGVDDKLLWLPDVFGYSGALPQIMKGCGIEGFSTHKIWWAYNGGDEFPYNDFWWQGIDGTRLRTFLHRDYASSTDAGVMIDRWNGRKQKYGLRGFMIPFGYGDGGGGPSREFVENVRRMADFQDCPKMEMASPNKYFEEMPEPTDVYVGELYFQCHRGVQTSQSLVKWGNRKSEISLRETEFMGVLAAEKGRPYPLATVDECWKQVLLCQFHDILPGSSIKRVYDEAYATHLSVLDTLQTARRDMAAALFKGEGLTAVNSLSFPRVALVTLPEGWEGASLKGASLPVQELNGALVARVELPPMGHVSIQKSAPHTGEGLVTARITQEGAVLENRLVTYIFNRRGEIVSAKTAEGEYLRGLGNEMKLYRDIPVDYEAWDVDTSYEFCPVELPSEAEFEVVSEGPLAACLKITRPIHDSFLTQTVTLRADSVRLDFDTAADWHEDQKMLKVCFDVDVHADEALHEIQFGYIRRPNHRSRPFDFDRFEVPNHRWTALTEDGRGAAVLNDCKYGVNVLGSSINLTLLRTPAAPDATADRGERRFVYSFFPFIGTLTESGLIKEAYDLNVPALTYPGAAEEYSALQVSGDSVFLDTVKPAEDGSGDIVLRLYEAAGARANAALTVDLPFAAAEETDMLEEKGQPTDLSRLTFRPFEIKTIRLKK